LSRLIKTGLGSLGHSARVTLDGGLVDPSGKDTKSGEIVQRLVFRWLCERAIFMRKHVADCFEAALAEGERSRVKVLVRIASVIWHQAEARDSWLGCIQTEAFANEFALGCILSIDLRLKRRIDASGSCSDSLTEMLISP